MGRLLGIAGLAVVVPLLTAGPACAQETRNPFKPAVAVRDVPAEPSSRSKSSGAAGKAMPPRLAPVFIPPPPPGLPPLVVATPMAASASPGLQAAELPTGSAKPKSDVFLSRQQLESQRAKCTVSLKSSGDVKAPPGGTAFLVRLTVVGGRSCVKGIGSSHDWLTAGALDDEGRLSVQVLGNDTPSARQAELTIANTGTSLRVLVSQDASSDEFRKVDLAQ